jgi:hypothetical protein
MTDRLNSGKAAKIVPPSDPQERVRFWIERGNRILWGLEPTSKGDTLTPRYDLHWVCRHGHYAIEKRDPISAKPLTRHELDTMPAHIKKLGLNSGFLEYRDGQLVECA